MAVSLRGDGPAGAVVRCPFRRLADRKANEDDLEAEITAWTITQDPSTRCGLFRQQALPHIHRR